MPGGGVVNWPWYRRALSAFANLYTRLLLRVPTHDNTAGFRCYHRRVLEAVNPFQIRSSGYSFLYEMVFRVYRAGLLATCFDDVRVEVDRGSVRGSVCHFASP